MAAYHFDGPDDCYISYAHAPEEWRLDDGSRPPAKKPFVSPSYDPATRTFTGAVEWSPTFCGDAKWEYTMVFSESLNIICGGRMVAHAPDGSTTGERAFPDKLVYWRAVPAAASIFGNVFIQGRRIGLASYHFDGPDDCYISYAHAPEGWRLDDGSRPPAKKPFVSPSYDPATRTFTGAVEWSPTFSGDAKWEYTMVFSESLDAIVDGSVKSSRADGSAGAGNPRFARRQSVLDLLLRGGRRGVPLVYERHDEMRSEMAALLLVRQGQRRDAGEDGEAPQE